VGSNPTSSAICLPIHGNQLTINDLRALRANRDRFF
jgi:hypothetical protein